MMGKEIALFFFCSEDTDWLLLKLQSTLSKKAIETCLFNFEKYVLQKVVLFHLQFYKNNKWDLQIVQIMVLQLKYNFLHQKIILK